MTEDGTTLQDDSLVWDSQLVEQVSEQIGSLNAQLSKIEEETRTINRREEALQMKPTEFPELYDLKQRIKPLVQLW